MTQRIHLLLSTAIVFSQWTIYISSAFSTTTTTTTTTIGSRQIAVTAPAPSSSSRSHPHNNRNDVVYAQKNENDEIPIDDNNATTTPDNINSSSPSREKAAIIFLHGLGDSPDGWSSLAEALPNLRPSLADLDITYVFPPANMIGITVNGGEKMPGWFDVFDWPIGVDAKDDPKGLAMSVKRIEKIVTQLQTEENIDPSHIVLGGFSQGGAVALMAAYNRRKKGAIPFAGCICMSGWLPMKDYLDVSEESASGTPLFWAHGQYDDKILAEQQMYGVNKLEGVGVDVTAISYPVGHESSNYEEIDDMAGFLESVLCPSRVEVEKVPKYVEIDDQEISDGGSTTIYDEDERNALLYYLCAIGIEENVGVDDYIPTVATVL